MKKDIQLKPFILGYLPNDDVDGNLREFSSKEEADIQSEEWCEVYAENLEQAKECYEATFANWQEDNGLTVGNPDALKKPYYMDDDSIHKKPFKFKLSKSDVWGKFFHGPNGFISMNDGMIVARTGDICPIWNDVLPYKSVTVICKQEQVSEVEYWLAYVMGGSSTMSTILPDNRFAIRTDYQAW